ncbi:MAG: hypothetical protein P8N09_01275 [Planctomycetota bacterium]|jgi:hypothetical protein|nr:hypothetical protein [Planctomycetota bacterium]
MIPTYNSVTSAIFSPMMGWFGSVSSLIDILAWSILGGVVALLVYKWISNQAGIEKAKNDIKVHLLEIRLFQDDLLGVIVATGKILGKNALYIGHNILPMVVMFVPMMTILFQLEANYALDPIPVGSTEVMTLKLDPSVTNLKASDVRLELPEGLELTAPPVASGEEIAWRLRVDEAGDHVLKIHVGDEVFEKGLAAGGVSRTVPFLRTKAWEAFLYPGEAALPSDSPVQEIRLAYPDRKIPFLPDGEGGILLSFFLLSIGAGLALKGVFGVTL